MRSTGCGVCASRSDSFDSLAYSLKMGEGQGEGAGIR
jgi:hypothetical protein